jgi:hypothetical protein
LALIGAKPANVISPGTDGLTHITYSFVDSSGNPITPDPDTAAAVSSAVSQWNGFSGTTHVEIAPFAPNPDGIGPTIQIQLTSDTAAHGCAAYVGARGRIYYGPTFQQATLNGHGPTIIAHEFGHALGLADGGTNPNPPSIMNNLLNPLPLACTTPIVPTTTIQATDAAKVPICSGGVRSYQNHQNWKAGITTSEENALYAQIPFATQSQVCTHNSRAINFYVDGIYDSCDYVLDTISCASTR